jgi:hypothetical protein
MKNKPNTKTVLTNAQFDLLIDKYIETNNIKLADGYGVEGSFGGVMPGGAGPRHTFDLIDANDEFVATVDEKSFVALVNSETGASFKTNLDVVAALPE